MGGGCAPETPRESERLRTRRRLLEGLVTLGAAAAMGQPAAQALTTFPSRPLRLIVPFPPGGNIDTFGRLIAERLARELGQPVFVENRAGANAIVGTQAAVLAAPDGYTLAVAGTATVTLNSLLYRQLPFDPLGDLQILDITADTPLLVVVNPSVPASTLQEFAALARSSPGTLNFGSAGNGNTTHLAAELFRLAAGVEMTHVPFNGSAQALLALLSNQIQVMFDPVTSSLPMVRDGKLRVLGVTTSERIPALPDVPTVAEAGFADYVATTWSGIAVRRAVPPPVADRLRTALAAVHAAPEVQERIRSLGLLTQPPRPAAVIEQFLKDERERWSRVINARGIHLD
jgi:tripartite-type tricarboxylate transporter receptor subunit TctC